MKIIQAHNYYQQAGGEDAVVEAERALLKLRRRASGCRWDRRSRLLWFGNDFAVHDFVNNYVEEKARPKGDMFMSHLSNRPVCRVELRDTGRSTSMDSRRVWV